jgi:hypothetical protein
MGFHGSWYACCSLLGHVACQTAACHSPEDCKMHNSISILYIRIVLSVFYCVNCRRTRISALHIDAGSRAKCEHLVRLSVRRFYLPHH